MSESLNVPVVGIYTYCTTIWLFPILEQSRVAQVELECRPCTKMGMNYCPQKLCMHEFDNGRNRIATCSKNL